MVSHKNSFSVISLIFLCNEENKILVIPFIEYIYEVANQCCFNRNDLFSLLSTLNKCKAIRPNQNNLIGIAPTHHHYHYSPRCIVYK